MKKAAKKAAGKKAKAAKKPKRRPGIMRHSREGMRASKKG